MQGLSIALKSLSAHKLRTILAITGVFLGTLVLTAVTHIGSSIVLQADLETQKLGPNLVQVRAMPVRFGRMNTGTGTGTGANTGTGTNTNAGAGANAGTSANTGANAGTAANTSTNVSMGITTTLTMEDAQAICAAVPEIENFSMFLQTARRVRAGATQTTGQIAGVNASYMQVRSLELMVGRFVEDEDEEHMALVCVLGNTLAERLFGRAEEAWNRNVYIANAMFRVVGVLEAKGADFGGTSFDEQAFVPLRTYQRRLVNSSRINGLYLNLYDGSNAASVKGSIAALLRLRHRIGPDERDDFRVFSAEDAARLRDETLELITGLGTLSAGISFTVGGLGIFSIMILLVRARQLEIGVRRAVGASRGHIIRQFLTEAGIMAGSGGIMGVVLALMLVSAVYKLGGLPFVYEPFFCIMAALASVLAGVIAGAWPARQASRVEVVAALKNWE